MLYSQTGTCGVRDPFLVRDPVSGTVYLIATDLRIEAGEGWEAARERGSRSLIIWESKDLVHWGRERSYPVGVPEAGCVWAPEAVYDKGKKAFLVFFASMTPTRMAAAETPGAAPGKMSVMSQAMPGPGQGEAPEIVPQAGRGKTEKKHKIYAAYTEDFVTFSETFLYMERENHVIDTTIVESGSRYYRVSKDETEKRLILEMSDSLLGKFVQIKSSVLEGLKGVEGPEAYLLPDGKTWCLMADQFAAGKGYLPMVTEDWESGDFRILAPDEYDMGENKKRHGGILPVTDKEYEELLRTAF